jgi:hypothetical protein
LGKIKWRLLHGIDHEIPVSRKKGGFVENTLPSLIGMATFWMDTLTANQRDQAETITTVQAVPAIFRDAVKTIAVGEGDGFYNYCVSAFARLPNWEDIVMSHTIQFVKGDDSKLL